MPTVLWYLITLLAVVIFWFMVLKRPVYEAMFVAFLVLVAISGTWSQLPAFIEEGISTNLLYSMTAFVAMSIFLTKTKVIDGCIAIILAVLGHIPGGAPSLPPALWALCPAPARVMLWPPVPLPSLP